jgi:hypothetical protein
MRLYRAVRSLAGEDYQSVTGRQVRPIRPGLAFVPMAALILSLAASGAVKAIPSQWYLRQRVLSASDISYLGDIRMPAGADTTFAYGGLSGRMVNGVVHLFVFGNNPSAHDPVYEIVDPGTGYVRDYTKAPHATLYASWGDIYHGRRTSWDAGGAQISLQYLYPRGLYWNEATQLLYWTYGDAYNVTGRPDWGLGASALSDRLRTSLSYGPWRTAATDADRRTSFGTWRCGYLFANPADGSMLCGSSPQAGNSGAPWGPDAYGGTPWPTAATPSGPGAPNVTLPSRFLEYYFMGDPSAPNHVNADGSVTGVLRSFRRTNEQALWEPITLGGSTVRVNPALNHGVGSWGELDATSGAIWLNLARVRGVIFSATLAGAISQDSTDCTNAAHEWYSNAGVNPPIGACAHGCPPPVAVTGPVTTNAFPAFIIYDPDDLLAVQSGSRNDYTLEPTNVIDLAQTYGVHTANLGTVGAAKSVAGFYFDPVRKYLFTLSTQADDSAGPYFVQSLIHVFAVRDAPPQH